MFLGLLLPGPALAMTGHEEHSPRFQGAVDSPTQDSRSPNSTQSSVRLGILEFCLVREERWTEQAHVQEDGGMAGAWAPPHLHLRV